MGATENNTYLVELDEEKKLSYKYDDTTVDVKKVCV